MVVRDAVLVVGLVGLLALAAPGHAADVLLKGVEGATEQDAEEVVVGDEDQGEPGMGDPLTFGPGIPDFPSKPSAWLLGEDSGMDARWNAALIAARKDREAQRIRDEIEGLKKEVHDTRKAREVLDAEIAAVKATLGETKVAPQDVHGEVEQEPNDDCVEPDDYEEMVDSPTDEAAMRAEALPDLVQGLPTPPSPPSSHPPSSHPPSLPQPEEGEKTAQDGMFEGQEPDAPSPMAGAASAEVSGIQFNDQLPASLLTAAHESHRAHSMLASPSAFVPLGVAHDPARHVGPGALGGVVVGNELTSSTSWALMNAMRGETPEENVHEPEEAIPDDLLHRTYHHPALPPAAAPPVGMAAQSSAVGGDDGESVTEVGAEELGDITGCCVTVTHHWLHGNNDVESLFAYRDAVPANQCQSREHGVSTGLIHVPNAMCEDVKNQFEHPEQPEDTSLLNAVDAHTLTAHQLMNLPTDQSGNKLLKLPMPVPPTVVVDNELFTRVSSFQPDLVIDHHSVNSQDSDLAMPNVDEPFSMEGESQLVYVPQPAQDTQRPLTEAGSKLTRPQAVVPSEVDGRMMPN